MDKADTEYRNTPQSQNIFAILGICLFWIPFIGLILSIIGFLKSSNLKNKGKTLSIIGIVLSILFIIGLLSIQPDQTNQVNNNQQEGSQQLVENPMNKTKNSTNSNNLSDVSLNNQNKEQVQNPQSIIVSTSLITQESNNTINDNSIFIKNPEDKTPEQSSADQEIQTMDPPEVSENSKEHELQTNPKEDVKDTNNDIKPISTNEAEAEKGEIKTEKGPIETNKMLISLSKLSVKNDCFNPSYVRKEYSSSWSQADKYAGSYKNVREKVLADEQLDSGNWYSAFDGQIIDNKSKLDIDHFVPLAEAHRSGACSWTKNKKKDYYNWTQDDDHLIAVSASSNRSKSDKDPSNWMPINQSYRCQYLEIWIQIKITWDLSMNQAEYDFIEDKAEDCPN